MSDSSEQRDDASTEHKKTDLVIPEGKPKSGRVWKVKQTYRSSTQHRQGVLSHLCKSYEERKRIKDREKEIKAYERELRGQTNKKKETERLRREQLVFKRLENENKAAVYQEIKPEKLKSLSKKQLRQIRKTSVNKNGQVELVSPWAK
eukprot:gene30260-38984_t